MFLGLTPTTSITKREVGESMLAMLAADVTEEMAFSDASEAHGTAHERVRDYLRVEGDKE
ncbi:hypothetical protein E2542_SST04056 [Spatholobus suberectus]|nr:hypothetical protein E2542_SST04056 [Spatholobus suberectus]